VYSLGQLEWGQSVGCTAGFPRTLGGKALRCLQSQFHAVAFRVNEINPRKGNLKNIFGASISTVAWASWLAGCARHTRL